MTATWNVFNRYTGRVEAEPIYGENWLRWAYERRLGQLATRALASRLLFSTFYGWRMRRRSTVRQIEPFARQYQIDLAEAADPVSAYRHFNDFFVRRLRPEARPLPEDAEAVVFPSDGRHFLLRDLGKGPTLWAKNEPFSVETLLGPLAFGADPGLFDGDAVISRLAPIDYHRFHFPWPGRVLAQATLGGPLFSVHPLALRLSIRFLLSNKRTVSILEEARVGRWAMVEIGATAVGSIRQTHPPETPAERGAEKGYFAFGGSCVITLWPQGTVEFAPDLVKASGEGVELYARMGDVMGRCCAPLAATASTPAP
ncbi:MAG: phosphatidylserine decarboxylase [Opitutales bacterium]